jgi:hypothetical protein
LPTFDPQATVTTWGPITFQGVMDGEFFSAEFQEAGMSLHVGSQGFATFVVNANKSGMFKVTLSQESPTNRELSLAYAANLIQMYQMEDLNDATLVTGPETAIEKHAPVKRGNKVVGYEWTFLCAKLTMVAGGDL